ncbi:hypothetical protein V501_01950 [Pseudogymnoascus sp. VKM F-4519 (FW-2642)]|nr:hypothetical protein V501_01950 [Pseudogymnoascus sp. VKM F-4519 (FW-2642)]
MHTEKGTESAQSSADADADASPSSVDIQPDGGLEAWMVVAGAWGACFCSWGWINSVGVFQEYYGKNILKEYTPGTVSWILCLEAFFLLALHLTASWATLTSAVLLPLESLPMGDAGNGTTSPGGAHDDQLDGKIEDLSEPKPIFGQGAVSMGMDRHPAQYLVAIVNGSSTAGRLGAGVLADVYGPFNAWIAVTYAAGILVLSLWIPTTNDASTIAFASLFGICFGAYAAIQPALIAQITPIADIVSGPIAGHTLETSGGSYLEMKIMAGFLCLAGATFVLGAKLYATGYKLMAKF